MREVTLNELLAMASDAREAIWEAAQEYGREPKIYLHWTAGHYHQKFDDYHVNIDKDGRIFVSTDDLSEVLAHTWRRNSGSVGITLDCCAGATSDDLGSEPPTLKQIESMAQCIQVVADALWLTIDIKHVMTHGEAADNEDGLDLYYPEYNGYPNNMYGPKHSCERWDLQFLGTDESPEYTRDYDDPSTGGNVLRGKALWYKNQKDNA